MFEDKAALDVTLDGSMDVVGYMVLKTNPKKGKFTLEVVSTVKQSLEVGAKSSAEMKYETEKKLGKKKSVLRKV